MELKFQSASSKRALQHLKLCSIPHGIAILLMKQVHTWETNNGPEWTVQRLKDIKTWFVQSLSGNTDYSAPWIAHTHRNGMRVPKGQFAGLWDTITKDASSKKVIKALSALMIYTSYKSEKVTSKQYKKTVGSIRSKDVLPNETTKQLSQLGEQIASQFVGTIDLKWSFHPAGLNTGKPRTWSQFKYLESFLMGLNVPFVGAYLEKKSKDFPSCLAAPLWGDDRAMMSPGDINVIQERGFKPRVVAMPHASIQVALYPLHRALDKCLESLPTDCTHNQEEGARFAHQALKTGKPVYSVDLSGATDNFPRSLQIGVLNGLGLEDEAALVEHLSTSEWRLSHSLQEVEGEEYVRYTKGQPQGMYSSFSLFGLSHNLLCRWMCKKLDLVPEDSFRILGDDIVITDTALHNQYRKIMKSMRVPISEDKSLQSDSLAEFAGYIISPKGYWKPAKIPDNQSSLESNFYNYLKVTGHDGLKQLNSQTRQVARLVLELPEEVGGLGLNPKGLPMEERLSHLSTNVNELAIPNYYGIYSSLPAAKLDWFLQEGEVFLNWLNDQFSLFDKRVAAMLSDIKYPELINITEPRALAYQLSALADVEGKPNMQTMIGSTDKSIEQSHAFVTDFQKWKNMLTKATDIYKQRHSKESHKNIDKMVNKWNLKQF